MPNPAPHSPTDAPLWRQPAFHAFLLMLVGARLVLGGAVWQWDLFVTSQEDFARFWSARIVFDIIPAGGDPTKDYWYIEANPWLPLHIMLFHGFSRLGALCLPAVIVFQNVATLLVTLLCGLLARHLAGGRWVAAWVAAAFLNLSPLFIRTGSGFLSEPLFGIALLGQFYGTLLVLRHRTWQCVGLLAVANLVGVSCRYETWTFGALLFAGLVFAQRRQLRAEWPRLLAIAASLGLFPLSWMLFHWYAVGDPLGFLHLTRTQFALNLGPQDRVRVVNVIVTESLRVVPLVAALACLAGLPIAIRQRRWGWVALFGATAFLLVQIILLSARGESGYAFPQRFSLGHFLFAAAGAGAAVAVLTERLSAARVLAPAVYTATILGGIMMLSTERSLLRSEENYDVIRRVVGEFKASVAAPTAHPLLLMDVTDIGWSVVPIELAVPGQWEPDTVTSASLTMTPRPRLIAARPGSIPWRTDHTLPQPDVRSDRWEFYLLLAK